MMIYLASPYSHKSKRVMEWRAKEITRVGALLTKKYHLPMFLPITQSHAMSKHIRLGTSFDDWADIDLTVIKEKCDQLWIVIMDGWDRSVGVMHEFFCAVENNIPIYFIDPKTLRKTKCKKSQKVYFYF